MQPISKLTHSDIQRGLRESQRSANAILELLGVDNKVTPQQLHILIIDDLIKIMHYRVIRDRALCNAYGNQSVSAFTKFNTPNRADGGTIFLNPDCSQNEQLEALFHEYIHIKDISLPIYTDYDKGAENKAAFFKFYMELNGFQGDIGAGTSKPAEQIDISMFINPENIAKVMEKYKEFYKYVITDLQNKKFVFRYNDDLNAPPVFTIFNTLNRNDGGVVLFNPSYSWRELREALYMEYVHISGYILPIDSINNNSSDNAHADDIKYQNFVEAVVDMRAYILLMPWEQLMECLWENFYNIDAVLEKYNFMEKSSVLQWITINDKLSCHFAWVMYEKDNKDNIMREVIHDSCYYDHKSDPSLFDIQKVLRNPASAAALAYSTHKPAQANSTIDGKDYYCFAYYESDQSKVVRSDAVLGSVIVKYDRLLVIGWEKAVYDTIQYSSDVYKKRT